MNRSFLILATLLLVTFLASGLSERRPSDHLVEPLDTLPRTISGWRGMDNEPLTDGTLNQLRPTSYLSRTYRKNGRNIGLFIAYYAQQRSGETMHSPKHCLIGSAWEIWKRDMAQVPFKGQSVDINRYSIRKGYDRMLALYWYQSRKRVIVSEAMGKLLLVRDALVDGKTAGSLVRLTVVDEPGAQEDGLEFAALMLPEIQRCLGDR